MFHQEINDKHIECDSMWRTNKCQIWMNYVHHNIIFSNSEINKDRYVYGRCIRILKIISYQWQIWRRRTIKVIDSVHKIHVPSSNGIEKNDSNVSNYGHTCAYKVNVISFGHWMIYMIDDDKCTEKKLWKLRRCLHIFCLGCINPIAVWPRKHLSKWLDFILEHH